MSFFFEVLAKNPPSVLFVLAAFVLALSGYHRDQQAILMPWATNFFWAGVGLQILWLLYKVWASR